MDSFSEEALTEVEYSPPFSCVSRVNSAMSELLLTLSLSLAIIFRDCSNYVNIKCVFLNNNVNTRIDL